MFKKNIKNVILKLPKLTDFGVGLFLNGKGLGKDEYKNEFKIERERLLNSEERFNKICNWLSQIQKIKSINNNHSSYGLKHYAEEDIGYITNGVFIAAAIHCGFKFKCVRDSPNVYFNMSEKSIKAVLKKHKHWLV